jgi:hypothetical protein
MRDDALSGMLAPALAIEQPRRKRRLSRSKGGSFANLRGLKCRTQHEITELHHPHPLLGCVNGEAW